MTVVQDGVVTGDIASTETAIKVKTDLIPANPADGTALFKVQPSKAFASAIISDATEHDLFTGNLGALGGTSHVRLDGVAINASALGGAASVTLRLHADVNGVDVVVASAVLTAAGTATLADLVSTATGAGKGLPGGYVSRFIRLTYQFAATPTNAALSASADYSLATA